MLSCRDLGLGGIGDPPGAHGGVVAALDEQAGAVGEPPVATDAIELLGRDEVGQAPAHVIRVGRTQQLRLAPVHIDDIEPAIADIGSALARGVHAWIDDRAGCGQSSCRARRGDVHGVGRARQGEDGDAAVVVEGVLRDPRIDLAKALTARAFFVGQ